MTSSLKPLTLFSHATGPNPWKVAMVLEELGVPYTTDFMDFGELHTPKFEKYNPNGRVPAIVDPNNGDFVLWESGAIIEYLVENYDSEHKLHPKDRNDYYHARQWLYFQTSGQGPYFGQAAWFHFFHPEPLASAKTRYIKEIQRVTRVLDAALEGKEYLLGKDCTFADIAFVPWYNVPSRVSQAEGDGQGFWEETLKECKNFKAWLDRLEQRPAVAKVQKQRAEKREEAAKAQQQQKK